MKNDGLRVLAAPVLVEDFDAVPGGNSAHGFGLFVRVGYVPSLLHQESGRRRDRVF
jgi:hypothetical protein